MGLNHSIREGYGTKSEYSRGFLQLVIEFFCFGKRILFRVVCIASVDDGSLHVFVERKLGPEQDRRVVDAIYIPCTGYKGITKFLGIVVRKQFFSAVSIDIKNLIIYNYEKACEMK